MAQSIRRDRRAVSPVVAELLLVAIAVVLAAVIYVMASGLLAGPGTNKPYVTLAPATRVPSGISGRANYSIQVASASLNFAYNAYKVNLIVNNASATAVTVQASGTPTLLTIGGTTYRVVYDDVGGGGMLNAGDTFTISENNAPLPSGAQIAFYLIWASDGSGIQSQTFQT